MRTESAALFNACCLYLINYARRMVTLKVKSCYQQLAWERIFVSAFTMRHPPSIVVFKRVIYHKNAMRLNVTALT
jgi:hypothetical protein